MTRRIPPLALRRPLFRAQNPAPATAPPRLPVSRWAVQYLGFHPDPLQAEILDSPARRLILLCARQFGKSTIAALKCLHFALSRPNATILCVSPTLRRSTEWLRIVQRFYAALASPHPALTPVAAAAPPASDGPSAGDFAARRGFRKFPPCPPAPSQGLSPNSPPALAPGLIPGSSLCACAGAPTPSRPPRASAAATAHSLVFPNGSRILALPGTAHTNRGYSAHLLLFEEAAFVPDPVFTALLPSIAATGGALWLISSAGAPAGFFYDIWTRRDLPYVRFKADATQCPRITREHLEEARLALGDLRFRREYLCEFSPGELPIFTADLLESSLDDSFNAWIADEAA